MDLHLPDNSGAMVVEAIRDQCPEARMLLISSWLTCDEEVRAAVAAGARAYVLNTIDASDLRAVIHAVLRGERHFAVEIAARLASQRSASELTAPRARGSPSRRPGQAQFSDRRQPGHYQSNGEDARGEHSPQAGGVRSHGGHVGGHRTRNHLDPMRGRRTRAARCRGAPPGSPPRCDRWRPACS